MALVNIVDYRSNEHNRICDAVFEIFYDDALRYPGSPPISPLTNSRLKGNEHWTEWLSGTSVYGSVMDAMEIHAHVTLYVYDEHYVRDGLALVKMIHPIIRETPMKKPYWLTQTAELERTSVRSLA